MSVYWWHAVLHLEPVPLFWHNAAPPSLHQTFRLALQISTSSASSVQPQFPIACESSHWTWWFDLLILDNSMLCWLSIVWNLTPDVPLPKSLCSFCIGLFLGPPRTVTLCNLFSVVALQLPFKIPLCNINMPLPQPRTIFGMTFSICQLHKGSRMIRLLWGIWMRPKCGQHELLMELWLPMCLRLPCAKSLWNINNSHVKYWVLQPHKHVYWKTGNGFGRKNFIGGRLEFNPDKLLQSAFLSLWFCSISPVWGGFARYPSGFWTANLCVVSAMVLGMNWRVRAGCLMNNSNWYIIYLNASLPRLPILQFIHFLKRIIRKVR